MATNDHFNIIHNVGIVDVYLSIISNIFSGKYFPIRVSISLTPILYLIYVSILSDISTIAMKKTKDENLLKNIITKIIATINIIRSIYII